MSISNYLLLCALHFRPSYTIAPRSASPTSAISHYLHNVLSIFSCKIGQFHISSHYGPFARSLSTCLTYPYPTSASLYSLHNLLSLFTFVISNFSKITFCAFLHVVWEKLYKDEAPAPIPEEHCSSHLSNQKKTLSLSCLPGIWEIPNWMNLIFMTCI